MKRSADNPLASRVLDFLCVGAQKAGTTWMFVVMRESPGVFVPPIKEGNYPPIPVAAGRVDASVLSR